MFCREILLLTAVIKNSLLLYTNCPNIQRFNPGRIYLCCIAENLLLHVCLENDFQQRMKWAIQNLCSGFWN